MSQFLRTVENVSKILLKMQVSDRMPTTQQLSLRLKIGTGTLQKALSALQDQDAVQIMPRGHLGSYITRIDYAKLWVASRRPALKVLLPCANAPEFTSLAERFRNAFEALGVPLRIEHESGAADRMSAVLNSRVDACVTSELAFDGSGQRDTLTNLPLKDVFYYRRGSVFVVKRARITHNPVRVGLDASSIDHNLLTQKVFQDDKKNYRFIPCEYGQLLSALLADRLDMGVWHEVEIGVKINLLPLELEPLTREDSEILLAKCERANLIVLRDAVAIQNLLLMLDLE